MSSGCIGPLSLRSALICCSDLGYLTLLPEWPKGSDRNSPVTISRQGRHDQPLDTKSISENMLLFSWSLFKRHCVWFSLYLAAIQTASECFINCSYKQFKRCVCLNMSQAAFLRSFLKIFYFYWFVFMANEACMYIQCVYTQNLNTFDE